MPTLHSHSTNAADTSETQQQQQVMTHGDLLRPTTNTEPNLMAATSSSELSLVDDYGVKSMDDLSVSSKPVENISLAASSLTNTTTNTDNNIPTSTSTSTGTLIQDSNDIQQQQQQQNMKTILYDTTHAAATVVTPSNSVDQDNTSSNNTSSLDDDYDEDDTFSCLTGDVSQPCFYGHANDSTATWQSGLSDSNIDLVVPKVNIRHDKKQHSNQFIGHLSIMVCGDSGIGKSTLIHAFSLMPEIIGGRLYTGLQVNSLDDATKFENGENIVMDILGEKNISAEIKEYYASTTTTTTPTLEKNICFIDTPGYGAFVDAKAVIRSTTKYLERQFQQTNDMLSMTQPSTPKLARLLHNIHGGHSHVDVCLYLILDRIKPVDIEYLRSIQHLCNIIPVIVKSDLLSCDQEQKLKRKVLQELFDNKIEFYQCGYSFEQLLELCQKETNHDNDDDDDDDDYNTTIATTLPFSISTKPLINKHYHKTRSAKGYLKLMHLKDTLFYKHIDALRKSTISKFIQWRREQTSIQQAYRSQQRHQLSSSSTTSSFATIPPVSSLSSSSLHKQKQSNSSSITLSPMEQQHHHLTVMLDLEAMNQKLAAREIAERIQDLASKQRRSINLHMVNYITDQRQRLEKQKQERSLQLQHKYYIMTQQEKVKFLTSQLNGILAEFGLLIPGELNTGTQQKAATTTTTSTTSTGGIPSSSFSVWHIYPPPDVINQLAIFQGIPAYLLGAILVGGFVITILSKE